MTPEIRMHPLDEICLMCAKLNEGPSSTPIFESPDLMNLFNTVIGIQLKREEYLPENICLTCSFTLYRMLEIQRTIKRNIMHFKMNYQYRNACEKSKLLLNTNVIRNSNPNGLIISEVRGQVQVADDHFLYSPYDNSLPMDGDLCLGGRSPKTDPASPSSNASRTSNRAGTRLLRPIYMSVENIRDTESDGAIYSGTTTFQCTMCSKIFSRRNLMTRHMNSHRAQSRANSRASTERKKRVFKCKVCEEVFPEHRELNKHKIIHRKTLSCPNCPETFNVQRELDWHKAECDGRTSAGGKILSRRNTRCQSTVSRVERVDETADDMIRMENLRQFSKTPTLSEKLQSVQNWCNSATNVGTFPDANAEMDTQSDEDVRSTISRFTSVSQKTAYSCMSSRSGWSNSNISIRTNYSYKTAKTTRTLKDERDYLQSCRVTRSVVSRIKKIDMEIKLREVSRRSFGTTRSQATSRRHFDITKRAKLVKTNHTVLLPDAFICDCNFASKNLKEFMEHEVNHHKKLPLFTCRECNERFTQKRFLEKHKESHNRNYTCVWCFTKFVNEIELKIHLELHSLNSIPCGFCEASFISHKELKEHMDDMHSNESKKSTKKSGILIRIGQKRQNNIEREKEYRSIEMPQKSQPEQRKRVRTYSQYKAIRLGTVHRDRSPVMAKAPTENGSSEAPREQIMLPVAMDICRYSTPSPQISDTHERLSAKLTTTPPPSLEELGVFDTNFPVTNGNAEYPSQTEEEEDDQSPVASPTGRRKRSRSRITLTNRVTRQTIAQPLALRNSTENILPPYESWPIQRTSITIKPGILPQPCRMT